MDGLEDDPELALALALSMEEVCVHCSCKERFLGASQRCRSLWSASDQTFL